MKVRNVYVEDAGYTYRVAFHSSGQPLLVERRSANGGLGKHTALHINQRRGKQIIALARKKMEAERARHP